MNVLIRQRKFKSNIEISRKYPKAPLVNQQNYRGFTSDQSEDSISKCLSNYYSLYNSGKIITKHMYEEMLEMLLDAKRIKKSTEIFDHAERANCLLDKKLYKRLMDVFFDVDIVKAFRLYMNEDYAVPKDIKIEENMILKLVRYGHLEESSILFETAARPTSMYSQYLVTLCNNENIDHARTVMEKMITNKMKVSLKEYNHVVVQYARLGRVDQSLKVIRKNPKLSETNYYPHFVKGFLYANQLEEALSFFYEMKESKNPPKVELYMDILEQLAKEGRTTEIRAFIENMEGGSILPNATTNSHIITSLMNEGKSNQAITKYEEFLSQSIPITKEICDSITQYSKHVTVPNFIEN